MWIKTVSGNFVNSDYVKKIEYDGKHTNITMVGDDVSTVVAFDRDARMDVVTNIISGAKIMEVQ